MTTVSALTLVEIPDLGPAAALDGTELVIVEQDQETLQTTTAAIAALASSGAIAFTGKRAVAVVAGQTDDWAPNLANVSRLEVTPAGSAVITGLAGGTDGKYIIVTNVDAANDLTLYAENASSTAANRFAMNGDALLNPGWSAAFVYSSALSRWTRVG